MFREQGTVSLLLIGRTTLVCEALGVALAFSEHTLVLHMNELAERESLPRADVLLCEISSDEDLVALDGLPKPGAWVALMTKPNQELVHRAIRRGVLGIVTPHSSLQDLHKCIRQAKTGDVYFDDEIQRCLSGALRSDRQGQLSAREREIAVLVARGRTSRVIATQLHLSVKTISNHRRNIFRKLGVRDAVTLTRYVVNAGWISTDEERPRSLELPRKSPGGEDWPHAREMRRR